MSMIWTGEDKKIFRMKEHHEQGKSRIVCVGLGIGELIHLDGGMYIWREVKLKFPANQCHS